MKKALLIICLVGLTSSVAAASPAQRSCSKLSSKYAISRALSTEEIERHEMLKISGMSTIRDDIPQLPFGFENATWVTFKSKMRPGDKIVAYSTKRHSWQHLAGESGYFLIRSGCVVATYLGFYN